jgi:hypothetical protein
MGAAEALRSLSMRLRECRRENALRLGAAMALRDVAAIERFIKWDELRKTGPDLRDGGHWDLAKRRPKLLG